MGTALASHVARSFLAVAAVWGWSTFVLLLDLTKAFDKVLRELVLGWPEGFSGDQAGKDDHLRKAGGKEAYIDKVRDMIDEARPALLQAGEDINIQDDLFLSYWRMVCC